MLHLMQTPTWRAEHYRIAGPVRWDGKMPSLYVSLLGRFFSTGRFVYQQVSPSFVIHVVESGRGVMKADGKAYDVGPGDAFAFFPGCHYDYHDAPATPWRYTWITLDGSQARASFRQIGLTERQPLMHPHPTIGIEKLLAEIQETYAQPVVSASYAIASGWRLMDALATKRAAEAQRPQGVAEAARFLIDRHAMEVLTVEGLASQLQVSRSALFRHFREAYGVSPKQHLDAVRIGRAQRLLQQSSAPLKQIAMACGFASSRYFIGAFRKHCGVSPGAWRQGRRRRA